MLTMATVHQAASKTASVELLKGVRGEGITDVWYYTEDGFEVWRNDFGSNRWTVSIPASLGFYRDTCPVSSLDNAKTYIERVRQETKTHESNVASPVYSNSWIVPVVPA